MAFKDEGQSCIASAFRKVPAVQIEPTDLILTCPMSVRDAYNGNRRENWPQALVNLFHGLSSKVSEMEEEPFEWKQFLEWIESSHSENKWEGEITNAEFAPKRESNPSSSCTVRRSSTSQQSSSVWRLYGITRITKMEASVFIKNQTISR